MLAKKQKKIFALINLKQTPLYLVALIPQFKWDARNGFSIGIVCWRDVALNKLLNN